MKKSSLLLLSTAALMGLVSCGENNNDTPSSSIDNPATSMPSGSDAISSLPVSESSATIPSSSQGGGCVITVQEDLNRSLAEDYRYMTVYSGALANDFDT
ncbi:MAG: hypothetical protein VZR78_02390, partial [Candidatus Enteromonas sp.]|nr:hypothetical protein [Candidatus Enteromonas sp.]